MGLARLVDAPVLLVGDIDRGGIFAQLYGTIALLEEEERARVKGVIVNKFRGDRAILEPGLRQLEALCGVPVAGVVPYVHVDIDDEDSLTERFQRGGARKLVDVAVIRLPRISNFTDFSPFERYENLSLRYVDKVSDLHQPDMILLPGTKSTIADLRWLRQSGLEAAVNKAASAGTLVFGICGGFQMLGRSISDPEGAEGRPGDGDRRHGPAGRGHGVPGGEGPGPDNWDLWAGTGSLAGLEGLRYQGYEIHMGRGGEGLPPLVSRGNVYGSYIHGIFDAPGIADAVVKALCIRKGIDFTQVGTFDLAEYKERQYDLLADAVRAGLDMDLIYRVLEGR